MACPRSATSSSNGAGRRDVEAIEKPAMNLFQLAYACKIYASMTQFDSTYADFVSHTGGKLDFTSRSHLDSLLHWLRSQGCRQFAIKYHDAAAATIRAWGEDWDTSLAGPTKRLDQLTDDEIEAIGDAYSDLARREASKRLGRAGMNEVSIDPTGAAKILFAARPRSIVPWDDPIRHQLGFDGSRASFCRYLRDVRERVAEICSEAAAFGISAEDIPAEIGRPESTLPKLIDEYYWVTLTKKVPPPGSDDVAKWYRWSKGAEV